MAKLDLTIAATTLGTYGPAHKYSDRNVRSSADKDNSVVVKQSEWRGLENPGLVVANRWEPYWLLRMPSRMSTQTVEMSLHEAFLLSSRGGLGSQR